jgi:hypothetical protein
LLVVVAVGMMLLARATPSAEPFDPRSGASSGTRGLVLLLRRHGVSVDIVRSAPAPGDGRRVLVLRANLDDAQQSDLYEFVLAGGVVVWADPSADLLGAAGPTTELERVGLPHTSTEANVETGSCTIGALAHLRGLWVPSGLVFANPDHAPSCFGDGSGAFVVAAPRGDGWVVRLGDNEPFTNRFVRYADNAALATALLAPEDGAHVSILLGNGRSLAANEPVVTEDRSLFDLVRPGVWMALAQLAIAFIVFAVARAIRPGRPVREPEQVPVAGSEFVVATGRLMHRARHAERAGALLRQNAQRTLCDELHLPAATTVEALDAAVAERTLVPPGRVTEVLTREVYEPAGLLHLSNDLHSLHEGAERD